MGASDVMYGHHALPKAAGRARGRVHMRSVLGAWCPGGDAPAGASPCSSEVTSVNGWFDAPVGASQSGQKARLS